MNLQFIIVIFIGIVVAAILLRSVYRFFFVEKKSGYCGGCTGCSMSQKNKEEPADPYRSYLKL
ncbi:MAG: FeoB-associated Cys-rich membrane protein [Dysgonamonadaceae bacterium]|nr:FeoB-associated Cys-rich membrane protein [Dysgonamonadaceae bacterium]MDD4727182.1 FeoB-associated Cys-rich membrane protein [Dysgonamonadaceae bacterium]